MPAPPSLLAVALPLFTGLLHAWLYAQSRREPVQLWLAAAGFVLAAAALCAPAAAAGHRDARLLQLTLGISLAVLAMRTSLGLLGRAPARAEAPIWALAGAGLGIVAAAAAWPEAPLARALLGSATGPNLGPLGRALATAPLALLLGVAFSCRRGQGRAGWLVLAWAPWLAASAWDVAGAFGAHGRASFAHWAAWPTLATGSALLVRRFVRSMAEAERMARDLNALVEERSAALRRKELQLAHGEPLASLGALAAGVARATHAPLGFLDANLSRLRRAWHDRNGDAVPRLLAECRQAVEQLRAVVSQVLAVARRTESVREPVDLREVVASVLPIVRPLGGSETELHAELERVAPVPGDRRLLGQVALQLLVNAVQAGAEAPGRPHHVVVATEACEDHVRLRVEDSGPGIPAEILPRVFDPFFTPEEGERGPALGLAVVHQIVARHGGRVQLASDGSGTRVVVELPLASQPATAPSPHSAPAR